METLQYWGGRNNNEHLYKGKHFTALYKLDNNQLTIVYNLKGDSYPLDFETKSKPTLFLSVFKKD
jgi:hypothetical protein